MRVHIAANPQHYCRYMARGCIKLTAQILLAGLAVLVLARAQPSLADTKDAPVSSLVTVPPSIKLPRFDRSAVAETAVIARTTGVSPLPADIELSFTASPGLEVRIGDRVAKSGDIVWPVHVRVTGDPPDASGVDFRLAYTAAPNGAGGGSRSASVQVQRASLTVQIEPGFDASPADDAEVSIKTNSIDISEEVSIEAYLQIKNKSNQPFTVGPPDFAKPEFLKVNCPSLKPTVVATNGASNQPSTVEPSDSANLGNCALMPATVVTAHGVLRMPIVISVSSSSGNRAPIGEWLVLANVELTRGEHPYERRAIAVAEQKVKVGVPGISETLTLSTCRTCC